MIITIYRLNKQETIEAELKTAVGKDFPSNKVVSLYFPEVDEVITFRPYYRKKVNGVLNIFCEEEEKL